VNSSRPRRREEAASWAVGKSRKAAAMRQRAVEGSKITLVVTISYNGSPMVITYNASRQDKMAATTAASRRTWSATAQSSNTAYSVYRARR
jgi:hypothetical protein